MLLETLGDDIAITVTLSTPTKDIGIENKDLALTTPCHDQVPLETELTALKLVALEQFFLIMKSIKEIKDPNHEAASSNYVAILIEQTEFLKEENKMNNSIIRSLTSQYNNDFNSTATYNSINNNNDNNNNNNNNGTNNITDTNNNANNITNNNDNNYNNNNNNNTFSNNACCSSKTNNISNINIDKTSDTINDAMLLLDVKNLIKK